MAEIQDKTREWSERFGGILRASAETQFPYLYKGATGGIQHVISVENAGNYLELWREGSAGGELYYATTGAAIKPLPGLAKGARLDEALDRFFVLMAKVEKAGGVRPPRDDGQRPAQRRPQRKGMKPGEQAHVHPHGKDPMKGSELITPKPGRKPPVSAGRRDRPGGYSGAKPEVRKNIVEKVDPEIGPSMSVGHRKPSNLSPESSMRKLAKLLISDINKTTAEAFGRHARGEMHPPAKGGKPHPKSCPGCAKTKPPVKKNVVALTGNQPGSGRVKPARTRVTDPMKPAKSPTPPKNYKSPQGFSGRRMGTPGASGASRSGMVRQDAMGRKTSHRREKPDFGRLETKHDTPRSPHREHDPRAGGMAHETHELKPSRGTFADVKENEKNLRSAMPNRPLFAKVAARVLSAAGLDFRHAITHDREALLRGLQEAADQFRAMGKMDSMQGGRAQPGGGTKTMKPAMGGPGQPKSYGSTGQPQYRYGRKACVCDEVAKTMKAVRR